MDLPGNILKNIVEGMEVEINPQKDRSRKISIIGTVSKILTQTPQHTHGILVELHNGEIGRIKKIISNSSSPDLNQKLNYTMDEHSIIDIEELINNPNEENHFVEFKTSILWSVNYSEKQLKETKSIELKKYGRTASKFIIAKSIASFLNSDGGHLIVGVKEKKSNEKNEIVGIESEFFKLEDPCSDGYRRMILDQIIKRFFPSEIFHHLNDHLNINFKKIQNTTICHFFIHRSKSKVFINYNNEGHFFIRIDASSRELHGEAIVDYCLKRFT